MYTFNQSFQIRHSLSKQDVWYLLLMPSVQQLQRLSLIDNLGAINSKPTDLGGVWILRLRHRLTPLPPYVYQPSASKLQKPTDRPHSILPWPDIQFISWETCRRARGGGALELVSLQQPLLSMLYLGSFHPPAHSRVYMGPLLKDPRRSRPEFHHQKGKSAWQRQQDSDLWCHRSLRGKISRPPLERLRLVGVAH